MSRRKKLNCTSPGATTLPSRPIVRISTPPDAAKERVSDLPPSAIPFNWREARGLAG